MKLNVIEFVQFFILFSVLFIGAILFRETAENLMRFLIISGVCAIYFAWGIWHHSLRERINKIVIIEYGLVSFLIVLLAAMGLGIVRFF